MESLNITWYYVVKWSGNRWITWVPTTSTTSFIKKKSKYYHHSKKKSMCRICENLSEWYQIPYLLWRYKKPRALKLTTNLPGKYQHLRECISYVLWTICNMEFRKIDLYSWSTDFRKTTGNLEIFLVLIVHQLTFLQRVLKEIYKIKQFIN